MCCECYSLISCKMFKLYDFLLFLFPSQEYIDLYTNWLLNESIESSFTAFKRGFDLVMGTNYLADLFIAEEVEMLICGSQVRSTLTHTIICVNVTIL